MGSARHFLRAASSALLLVALAPAARGQDTDATGRLIGRTIAAGVVLSSQDFAAGGRYVVEDDADSVFEITRFGSRVQIRERGASSSLFLDLAVAEVVVDQNLDLGGPVLDDFSFTTRSARAAAGLRAPAGGPWFVQGVAGLEYSWVDNELTYRSPESAALRAILDGTVFNWSAEALTLSATGIFGYARETRRGLYANCGAQVVVLRTDAVKVDHPVQDVATTSGYARLYAAFDVPLGLAVWDAPLVLAPKLAHTWLSDELEDPLDSRVISEVALTGAARVPPSKSLLGIERVGLTLTYTRADAFHGWSLGVALSRWSP